MHHSQKVDIRHGNTIIFWRIIDNIVRECRAMHLEIGVSHGEPVINLIYTFWGCWNDRFEVLDPKQKKQSYIHCTPKAKIVSRKNNCLSFFSQWYGCVHTESQISGICSTIGCGNNRPYYELAPSLSLCKWDSGLWLHTVSCPSTERTTRIVTWLIKDKRIRSII